MYGNNGIDIHLMNNLKKWLKTLSWQLVCIFFYEDSGLFLNKSTLNEFSFKVDTYFKMNILYLHIYNNWLATKQNVPNINHSLNKRNIF